MRSANCNIARLIISNGPCVWGRVCPCEEQYSVNVMNFICTAAVMLLAMAWAEYYIE